MPKYIGHLKYFFLLTSALQVTEKQKRKTSIREAIDKMLTSPDDFNSAIKFCKEIGSIDDQGIYKLLYFTKKIILKSILKINSIPEKGKIERKLNVSPLQFKYMD